MGLSIVEQPDGLFAVFSTESDTFLVMDATEEEVTEYLIACELEQARARTALTMSRVKDIGQSGMNSYADCLSMERRSHYAEDDPRYQPWQPPEEEG